LKKPRRSLVIWLVVLAVGLFVAFRLIDRGPSRTSLSLDRYQTKLENGRVDTATLLDQDHMVRG
jgi:hypothetical protein